MLDSPFRIIGLEQHESTLNLSEKCRKLQEMGYYCRAVKVKIYEDTKVVVCYCYRDFTFAEMQEFLQSFDIVIEES